MVLCLLPPTLCLRSARATPLEYAVTKNASASPLECAVPKSLDLKPPEMNSYKKSGGPPLSFRNLPCQSVFISSCVLTRKRFARQPCRLKGKATMKTTATPQANALDHREIPRPTNTVGLRNDKPGGTQCGCGYPSHRRAGSIGWGWW